MKKLISGFLLLTVLLTGCKKEDSINTPSIEILDSSQFTQQVFADQTQGESELVFSTTAVWTTSELPDWLSITPDNGSGAGDYTVSISLLVNYTGEDRSASILISCKETTITVNVTQMSVTEDGSVPVDKSANINFPDVLFKQRLLDKSRHSIDTNDDGEISIAEAENYASEINVAGTWDEYYNEEGIKDLTGIAYFKNITELDCAYNNLTSLDVSQNTRLTSLHCYDNNLNTLNIEKNTALIMLYCGSNELISIDLDQNAELAILSCVDNNLSSLDVSDNTALEYLHCEYNKLTTLDVSHNTVLELLNCEGNNLSSFNVSPNFALKSVHCGYNNLSSLDVSQNTALTYLSCDGNNLSSLDVSQNTLLKSLYCVYNNLTSLDVSQNTLLEYLYCFGNNISCIKVASGQTIAHEGKDETASYCEE
ncbi:BACON domain-containing protein [Mangrovibacterium diazotrophicum]|uniref:All-beta uncharacterized protein n=1 Tax=Mangrovibacterium diazotrophicum TaxID=1261403 RepID=A0A419W889_9BACT|nr:BACON domain-containing carbohydrate-binding protein [Mangrovibacterium diazotrophicum]RKD91687.1 all-beta uncharacterized protein [Mangrovibacterium diazotrophicum]